MIEAEQTAETLTPEALSVPALVAVGRDQGVVSSPHPVIDPSR